MLGRVIRVISVIRVIRVIELIRVIRVIRVQTGILYLVITLNSYTNWNRNEGRVIRVVRVII